MATAWLGTSAPVIQGTRVALDLVFRNNALVLMDALTLAFGTSPGAVPLIGFTYENAYDYTMLKFSYSEYPYLNKSTIATSYVKENPNISIRSFRAITAFNSVITNIAINTAMIKGLDMYCCKGGTFGIFTMWDGFIKDLVLEELRVINAEDGKLGGIGLDWRFKKLDFSQSDTEAQISNTLKNLQKGTL